MKKAKLYFEMLMPFICIWILVNAWADVVIAMDDIEPAQAKVKGDKHNTKFVPGLYRAKIIDIYDGDTITADVYVGFNTYRKVTFRLYGINAPEMRGPEKPEGTKVRDWLRQRILYKGCIMQTELKRDGMDKKGKFGRWLGTIWLDGVNINQEMIEKGMAKIYK